MTQSIPDDPSPPNPLLPDLVPDPNEEAEYRRLETGMMARVSSSRTRMILRYGVFGSLALGLQLLPGMVGTACTDGVHMWWDPRFVKGLTNNQLDAVMAHEVMHDALRHHTRIKGRMPGVWNMATDYVINALLKKENPPFELPEPHLYRKDFEDLPAETVYDRLVAEGVTDATLVLVGGGNPDLAKGGVGGVVFPRGVETVAQVAELERHWRSALAAAANTARLQGHLSAGMDKAVRESLDPPLPWDRLLHRFIDSTVRATYTYARPNRRLVGQGIVLPSMIPDHVGPLAVVWDTSASTTAEITAKFGREVRHAIERVRPTEVRVYYVDAKVCGEEVFLPGDEVVFHAKGGGGTSFRPAFGKMEKDGFVPVACVYFTDLACDSYPDEPDFPVLWAHHGTSKDAKGRVVASERPPFGELIEIL
jgi:predicted metal-dependent peptidase